MVIKIKLLTFAILIVLIIHLFLQLKKIDNKLFLKIKNIFFCKEIGIPVIFLGYRILPDFLFEKYVFIETIDKIVIFLIICTIFFKINNIKINNKKIELNLFIFLSVVISNFIYEYFYNFEIWLFTQGILLILDIFLIKYKKDDFSLKFLLLGLLALTLFVFIREYKEDIKLSKKKDAPLFINNKFDFSDFSAELVEEDGIIKTNRFKIEFNGSVFDRDNNFIEKIYKSGNFNKNKIHYDKIYNFENMLISYLKENREITEKTFENFFIENEHLDKKLNETEKTKQKKRLGDFLLYGDNLIISESDYSKIYKLCNSKEISKKDILYYSKKINYIRQILELESISLEELREIDIYGVLDEIYNNEYLIKLNEKENEKLELDMKNIDAENILKWLIIKNEKAKKIFLGRKRYYYTY